MGYRSFRQLLNSIQSRVWLSLRCHCTKIFHVTNLNSPQTSSRCHAICCRRRDSTSQFNIYEARGLVFQSFQNFFRTMKEQKCVFCQGSTDQNITEIIHAVYQANFDVFFFTLLAVTNSTSILPAFTTVVIVYARKKVSEKKLSRSRKISVSDKLCSTKKNIPHKFFISESNSHTREIWIWDFGRMEVVSQFFFAISQHPVPSSRGGTFNGPLNSFLKLFKFISQSM